MAATMTEQRDAMLNRLGQIERERVQAERARVRQQQLDWLRSEVLGETNAVAEYEAKLADAIERAQRTGATGRVNHFIRVLRQARVRLADAEARLAAHQ